MIRLAVIGTNWITDQFIEAALFTQQYQLSAIYSRSMSSAEDFAQKYQALTPSPRLFDDLEQLAQSDSIDAVYIASPNSLHAQYAIQMMQAGKHVICEKPLAANARLAEEMFAVAEQNNVVLCEAFMSPHTPNFKILQSQLPNIGALRKAFITYCQYSSRYPKYLAGENPNTFNPQFANGSIMDIGFYCLASAVALFGRPEKVYAQAQLLPSGVDGSGSVVLTYPGFEVVLQHSKTSDSFLSSEFQGEEGALHMQMISVGKKISKIMRGQAEEDLSVEQHSNPMVYEALDFAEQLVNNKMNPVAKERSLIVAQLLTEIRRQTGVKFPQDQ
ncbi:Gfo/Idh/MocA family protein [Vibrio renipiscarius]|uniref:Gfo/Idh/MocA family protein n=1 Tax=Vibrio renipiscarius TaxID=1461322 RepID=UPI00354B6116